MNEAEKGELFWNLAEPLLATGRAERGTMMGFACLRSRGQFFASLERGTNNLIVKAPASRVNELVASEQARNFAPNGRVFREWALVDQVDEARWAALLEEAYEFVTPDEA